jgi:hypothetical protein
MSDDPLDYEPVDDWLSFDIRSISVIRVSHLTVSGMTVIDNLRPNDGYRVVFGNLTREWYEFELSIIEQVKPHFTRTISTSLFPGYTQPSLVRGNIDGALGCFGVGTERWYDIE